MLLSVATLVVFVVQIVFQRFFTVFKESVHLAIHRASCRTLVFLIKVFWPSLMEISSLYLTDRIGIFDAQACISLDRSYHIGFYEETFSRNKTEKHTVNCRLYYSLSLSLYCFSTQINI